MSNRPLKRIGEGGEEQTSFLRKTKSPRRGARGSTLTEYLQPGKKLQSSPRQLDIACNGSLQLSYRSIVVIGDIPINSQALQIVGDFLIIEVLVLLKLPVNVSVFVPVFFIVTTGISIKFPLFEEVARLAKSSIGSPTQRRSRPCLLSCCWLRGVSRKLLGETGVF
ncbi:MAG TPA: hypothetical protein DEP84_28640 [Chloroflexi bacterium]|nr:hypothetical protein [Chloroflexota bacterium]